MMKRIQLAKYEARHFDYKVSGKVATITLNRPERKNPLTFESYGELRDLFREMVYATDIKAVVFTGAGGNFCSGGDVHEIIGPLVKMDMTDLLRFTRMTGDVVKAMRSCPQPIISAIDGVCTGAGAMIACASDMRFATARSKVAFLFVRVGLAAADMGACTLLPRLIGLSRAADWLYTGRVVGGEEGERAGFYNRLVEPEKLLEEATAMAPSLADGRAKDVQRRHRDLEAVAGLAEHPIGADAAIGQTQRTQRMRRDKLDALRRVESRCVGIDDECGQSLGSCLAGARKDDIATSKARVRDPGLDAVDAPRIAVARRGGGNRRDIGTGFRLG